MGLSKYREKRDFSKTSEPSGNLHQESQHLYMIQKHAASHLHYDFRLELDGVLKSWAVPKGPCLDPSVKRLGIHVEDHPIEYGTFEGIIPKGEYGGGTVLLWDEGTWQSLDEDPLQAYQKGHLRFELQGEKLKGRWDFIHFHGKEGENTWFLVKYKDQYAESLKDYDITKEEPNSVKTGQSIAQITRNYQAVWSKEEGKKKVSAAKNKKKIFRAVTLNLSRTPFPTFISPELATLVHTPPSGDEWAHEIKLDGYRILAFKRQKKVTLLSRNNKDWTLKFQSVADEIKQLPLGNVVLDGELVLLDKNQRSNFQLLQNASKEALEEHFIYYVFDVLYYDQWDTRSLTLLERKTLLEPLLLYGSPTLQYSDHVIGQGREVFKQACHLQLEGIIAKRIDSTYTSKRTKAWLKIKCVQRQEFVVGGFTPPQGSRSHFGSLCLGVYDARHTLHYCGNVGTGFTEQSLQVIHKKLEKLICSAPPFTTIPPDMTTVIWVKPELVIEVEFSEWTKTGRLRHPSFKGVREDKDAAEISREEEKSLANKNTELTTPKKALLAGRHLSNPDKILYPEDNITKGDLFNYYEEVCSYILPYLVKRPLTLVRCPSTYKECFFQKHFNKSSSKALRAMPIESNTKKQSANYIYITDRAGLLGLVQMGVLEIHPWGSTIEHLEYPDILTFDLDPSPELEWEKVVKAAFEVRHYLQELNLRAFVKSTGGKGLHVVVPIQPEHDWSIIKEFTKLFAEFVEQQTPDWYVTNMSKAKRKGKLFLDYLRNQRNATAIASYSTRAKPHAPVATPLFWDELSHDGRDTIFTIKTLPQRLRTLKRDPWEEFWLIKQHLNLNA